VLVDEATVEVVIGSVVVVAALLVVAADVVVSETSNASSLVTHPTTNDLRRVPSPSSVRLHLILVIGSFSFFGARAPLFQAVLHAAHDLRLTHVHTFLVPLTFLSTTLLHSTRRRVAALGLLQVSFSLASHLPAALTRLPTSQASPRVHQQPTTLRVASRSSSATADELRYTPVDCPVRTCASRRRSRPTNTSLPCARTPSVRPVRPSVRPSVHRSLAARTTTPRSTTRRRHNQRYKTQRAWPDAKRTNLALCSSQQP
jgi:hypothetical protein